MKVGLPASLVQGESRESVDVLDLNIHGMAFQSEKFFTRGTRLEFVLPFKKTQGKKKFPGEVIQCRVNEETLDGSYRVGVKFLFGSKRFFTQNSAKPSVAANPPAEPIMAAMPVLKDAAAAQTSPDAMPPRVRTDQTPSPALNGNAAITNGAQKTERVFGLTFIRKSRFYFLSSD